MNLQQTTQEQPPIADTQKVAPIPKEEYIQSQEKAQEELQDSSRGTHFKVKEDDFVPDRYPVK